MATPPVAHHSAFGGLWIDRLDGADELARRGRDGRLEPALAAEIGAFMADGFVVLQGAAEFAAVDAFRAEIERSFRDGNPSLLYQQHGSRKTISLAEPIDSAGARVVDAYAVLPTATDLLATPRLMAFLTAVFDGPPMLFQSLSFDRGSQQPLHQDTAYVVVDRPLELAACWIALEDIAAGSGELMYVPGSHRLGDSPFWHGKKHWDEKSDGHGPHALWASWLVEESARRGLATQSFLARKGDILIWHADLAHGGRPVVDQDATRQSLVGHFCPATRRPKFMLDRADRRAVRRAGALSYASGHYDLSEPAERTASRHPPKLLRKLAKLGRRLTSSQAG